MALQEFSRQEKLPRPSAFVVVGGASGRGKTSFVGTFDDVLLLSIEGASRGLHRAEKTVIPESWDDIVEWTHLLKTGHYNGVKTIAIDSITSLQHMIIKPSIESMDNNGGKSNWAYFNELKKRTLLPITAAQNAGLDVVAIIKTERRTVDKHVQQVPLIMGSSDLVLYDHADIIGYMTETPDGGHFAFDCRPGQIVGETKDTGGVAGLWVVDPTDDRSGAKLMDKLKAQLGEDAAIKVPVDPVGPRPEGMPEEAQWPPLSRGPYQNEMARIEGVIRAAEGGDDFLLGVSLVPAATDKKADVDELIKRIKAMKPQSTQTQAKLWMVRTLATNGVYFDSKWEIIAGD